MILYLAARFAAGRPVVCSVTGTTPDCLPICAVPSRALALASSAAASSAAVLVPQRSSLQAVQLLMMNAISCHIQPCVLCFTNTNVHETTMEHSSTCPALSHYSVSCDMAGTHTCQVLQITLEQTAASLDKT